MMIGWNQAREMVRELRAFTKVYGTFTPRKINGVNTEYSLIISDKRGQLWHFFTGDLRHGKSFATIRKVAHSRDFTGERNQTVSSVEQLKTLLNGVAQ